MLRLYTFQPLSFWEEAQRIGVMTPHPDLIEQDFRRAYDWMRQQMAKRLSSYSGDYPIWAWVKRPDLRTYRDDCFTEQPHVLLTVEVPESRVLVSDYEVWHYILNGWFVSLSEEEDDFRMENPATPEEIQQSWEVIFDPERLTPWATHGDKQACIDRLYPHEVVHVQPIKLRKPRRR